MGQIRDCACHCKDTHFEAIHNDYAAFLVAALIVLATAKIHILKQFTTRLYAAYFCCYCACHCKDTHFEAIHNDLMSLVIIVLIVLATAKIHILKQFTTHAEDILTLARLCLPLQRYTF